MDHHQKFQNTMVQFCPNLFKVKWSSIHLDQNNISCLNSWRILLLFVLKYPLLIIHKYYPSMKNGSRTAQTTPQF